MCVAIARHLRRAAPRLSIASGALCYDRHRDRRGRGRRREEVRLRRTVIVLLLLLLVAGSAHASPADEALVHLDIARALIGQGEPAAAVAALREALRLDPDLVDARTTLGFALYGAGDLDAAIEELRSVLRRDPGVIAARLHLGTALMARQDWSAARTELEDVVRRQPDHLAAHYRLGVVRYTLGDLPGAIDAYRRVLAAEPGHHDARYNLALTLRLARRDAEATREFLTAAEAGVPRAQYFAGTAYAGGLGVPRDLAAAVTWWFRAAGRGVAQAEESLAQLRRVALGRGRHPAAERQAADDAFRAFRLGLWRQYLDVDPVPGESAGAVLLARDRGAEAVVVLLREAAALGEPAQRLLVSLYQTGVDGHVAPHDPRILAYLRAGAAEGFAIPRIGLARVYADGLGVPKDVARAVTLLKGTPHEDAQRLLQELSTSRVD